jgi:hypothetical protein
LIECAKIHNIKPEDYLRCIFEQAANTDGWTEDDWKKLLSWNIKITLFIPQGTWISFVSVKLTPPKNHQKHILKWSPERRPLCFLGQKPQEKNG